MGDVLKAILRHRDEAFEELVDGEQYNTPPSWFYWDVDRSLLIKPPGPPRSDRCSNSVNREGLWAQTDDVKVKWIVNPQLPFLNQLAQLCKESQIRQCGHCLSTKDRIRVTAPLCDWEPFREWAITAMSCQRNFSHAQQLTRAHTHLVTTANICHYLLARTRGEKEDISENLLFQNDSGRLKRQRVGLLGVCDVIYWMLTIQAKKGLGDTMEAKWGPKFLPHTIIKRSADEAMRTARRMRICQNRVYALINVAERKGADLPGLMEGVRDFRKYELQHLPLNEHKSCDEQFCRRSKLETETVSQLHKEDHKICEQMTFPAHILKKGIDSGTGTVWSCDGKRILDPEYYNYVAISHVWADGTGEGLADKKHEKKKGEIVRKKTQPEKKKGDVNSCLAEYFTDIVKRVQKKMEQEEGIESGRVKERMGQKEGREWGIWWDTISLPDTKEEKKKALDRMQDDYRNASCTVVHDEYLLNFKWRTDGTPCVAIVLSPWFSRYWTALELHNSARVKVLFRNPRDPQKPVIKDLDKDILATDPATTTRAHWIASSMIRRLRGTVRYVKDKPQIREVKDTNEVLAILQNRMTTKPRDRIRVAAYLANLKPDVMSQWDNPKVLFSQGDDEKKREKKLDDARDRGLTREILKALPKIGHASLLHGGKPMEEAGPFSWCPRHLMDMPLESAGDLEMDDDNVSPLEVDRNGVVKGEWHYRVLTEDDDLVPAFDLDPKKTAIMDALSDWENCLLLREFAEDTGDGLLVTTVGKVGNINNWDGIIDCRYVGPVKELTHSGLTCALLGTIRIGHSRSPDRDARKLLNLGYP